MPQTVLLTGGGGMVGRNILEHPDAGSWRLVAPPRQRMDLGNYESVSAAIAFYRPDVVVHVAGRVGGIQANMADPVGFLVENVDIARNLVLAARAARVPRLINVASSCMYPKDASGTLREDMILSGVLEPTNEGYALAKIVAFKLCEYVTRETGGALSYKTVIPCNLYGRFDKFDPAVSHLVPAIIRKVHDAIATGADTIEIWGDGTARREFMYAGDFADFVFNALRDFERMPPLMNVGLGEDLTVNQYYEAVAEVLGYRGRFMHDLSRPVGMRRKVTDVSLQRDFGWKPRTDLRRGIELTYQYFLEGTTR